jgi:hypothetical protein
MLSSRWLSGSPDVRVRRRTSAQEVDTLDLKSGLKKQIQIRVKILELEAWDLEDSKRDWVQLALRSKESSSGGKRKC